MPPSEGGDAGSIPAESTEHRITKTPLSGEFLLLLKKFGDLGLAAGGRILLYNAALERLVDSFVRRGERRGVAFGAHAHALKRIAERLLAAVVHCLFAQSGAVRLLGRSGYSHTQAILL